MVDGHFHEAGDVVGGMLAVSIHEKRMRESRLQGCFHRHESRATFAMILWQ
jgi:hypothetical protein